MTRNGFDPTSIAQQLHALGLPATRHHLIWIDYRGPRLRPTDVDEWLADGPVALLRRWAYDWTYTPDTTGVGIWLPDHHTTLLIDTAMQAYLIPMDVQPADLPHPFYVGLVTELRALLGEATMRPGRMTAEDPILISNRPLEFAGLIAAVVEHGHTLQLITPEQAPSRWNAPVAYMDSRAMADLAALGLPARADLTILATAAAAPTEESMRQLATDNVLDWPDALAEITHAINELFSMQAHVRASWQ